MNKYEEALKIIDEEGVCVGLLKKHFKDPDDPFLLKYQPDMCCGLYRYNEDIRYIDGAYSLNIKQYNLLKEVLNWRD